jgi:4-deoxy-L-threo-5-hexosulose-uronate ketol-isomerase
MRSIYAIGPDEFRKYNTEEIYRAVHIDQLFIDDQISFIYTHYDRMMVGGAAPLRTPVRLETNEHLKSSFFLERREIGIINVGAESTITADGETFTLDFKEALYIGQGVKEVIFHPARNGKALFYLNSAPAHCSYPTRKVTPEQADTSELGSPSTANQRSIKKLIVNSVMPTCQLQMGLTELKSGSVWNTMPPHTHTRRMEVYFYFEVPADQAVCHFVGEPMETRHVWMKNNQAVLSPPWSVHAGAGTSNYSFIWSMAGENLDYGDMDLLQATDLR